MSKRIFIMIPALIMLLACGGKKTQTGGDVDSVMQQGLVADSTDMKVQKEIVGIINELYAAAAKNAEDIDGRFACQAWRDTVAAVNEKDAHLAEIGFFNEDYWTDMQDSNADDLEARDIKFEQLDVEQGRQLSTSSFIVLSRPFTRSSSSVARMVTGVYTTSSASTMTPTTKRLRSVIWSRCRNTLKSRWRKTTSSLCLMSSSQGLRLQARRDGGLWGSS